MYEFTVLMAIVDFVPVAFFAVAAVLMLRDFYESLTKGGFALLAAGLINIFAAGFLKALWKLLYAAGVCDFHVLNTIFLPTQSIGFMMSGLALIMLLSKRRSAALMLAAPPVFKGSIIFLSMMVVGLGCMCAVLSIISFRKGKKLAGVLFIMAFVASMGMGYAGTLDPTLSWVNWFEQSINIISQACLMGGMLIIHKEEKAHGR